MAPLAPVLDVAVDKLADTYVAALPVAERMLASNPEVIDGWADTMRHLRRTKHKGWDFYAPLSAMVAFARVATLGTMRLESIFSHLESFTSGRQGNCLLKGPACHSTLDPPPPIPLASRNQAPPPRKLCQSY